MTEQKSLKRRTRARMSKTGERYTAARRQVLAGHSPAATPHRIVPPPGMTADETMRERTGRGWAGWIRILDAWGAAERPHVEIARWLNRDEGVDGWWSQQITVGYEIAIGRRVVGQRGDGRFSATATRTVGVAVEQLQEAVTDDGLREQWLPRARLRPRVTKAERTARFDWDGGPGRVVFWFESLGDAKSRVAMEHELLPDADAAAEMKAYWRGALVRLKELVEG